MGSVTVGAPRPFARYQLNRPVSLVNLQQVSFRVGTQLPRRRPVYTRTHGAGLLVSGHVTVLAQEAPVQVLDYGLPRSFTDEYSFGGQMLGRGSFGQVYKCQHRETGEELAVKAIKKRDASVTADRVKLRVLREISALQHLQSSNTVKYRGAFEDDDTVFIVQEIMMGGDLGGVIDAIRGRGQVHAAKLITEPVVARVVYECLSLLATAHSRGYVHLDVKPANFMLSSKIKDFIHVVTYKPLPKGWLKAVDLGCAGRLPETGEIKGSRGTPLYMAPEVFAKKAGKEADLWSLGMMMYFMVANRFPFWETLQQCHTVSKDEVQNMVSNPAKDIPMNYGPWLSFSAEGKDLLKRLLKRDRKERISAVDGLRHPWFRKQPWWNVRKVVDTPQSNIVLFHHDHESHVHQ